MSYGRKAKLARMAKISKRVFSQPLRSLEEIRKMREMEEKTLSRKANGADYS